MKRSAQKTALLDLEKRKRKKNWKGKYEIIPKIEMLTISVIKYTCDVIW